MVSTTVLLRNPPPHSNQEKPMRAIGYQTPLPIDAAASLVDPADVDS
jgi:hypothetical protein